MHARTSLPAALLLTLSLLITGLTGSAWALLASHDCSYCHSLHGGFSFSGLLKYSSTEQLCLSCHSVKINNTEAAAVHNPLNLASNQLGYITCRECHTPHDNIGGNVKLVGYKYDPSKGQSFAVPTIREELPSSNPAAPVYRQVTFQSSADFNIDGLYPGPGVCQICHSPNHNAGQDCSGCHGHEGEFAASGSCTACHTGLGTGALAVGPDSPHSEVITGYSCSACHSGHGTAGTVVIPNNPAVGINYSANGETGIALGSATATGATEAEICWNCHASLGISEWGTNTRAATGNSIYNYGVLDQSNWVGATWSSANFSYKSGTIQSTHSVNSAPPGPGVDPVASIRCSYCHDVHELALAPNDTAAGKPYLRGTWRGNPYREDGAPLTGGTWTTNGNFGAVPRGGTQATQLGGYQIDQNNGNPTTGWTLSDSAGLCTLCHGSNVDTMNKFGTPVDAWVGTNGHSNAVIGGTGLHAVNIFREDWRKPNDGFCAPSATNGYCAGKPNMANQQQNTGSGGWAFSFRGTPGDAQGFLVEASMSATFPQAYLNYNWGATVNATTTDPQYHKFSCSKCHNPHASRLPRLMITNCLDVSHNTWDDSPKTMVRGDSITISGATTGGKTGCSTNVNATHTVDLLVLSSKQIQLSTSFTTGCNRQDITLTWQGTPYSLTSVSFVAPNKIVLNAFSDFENNFIGKQVPSSGSINAAGTTAYPVGTDSNGVQISRASSAQNCHRYVAGKEAGWNRVTPW